MVHGITSNVEQKILHYMEQHPKAADTAEGIAIWWLNGNNGNVALQAVESALDNLVAKGLIRQRHFPDGHVLYSRMTETGK